MMSFNLQGWESSGFRPNPGFLVVPGVILEIRLNVHVHYNRELLTPCAPAAVMSAILSRFSLSLGPKYTGIPGVYAQGSWNQTTWSLQRAIYYTMKQDLKPCFTNPCATVDSRPRALCNMYRVERGYSPSLWHCSPPSHDPVCSTLCSNCCNCLLAKHLILHDFLWHVQCMVHGSQAFGWFNPLFFEPVGMSPHPAIWLRQVGLLSSQSEPWVDTTCSLKTEHPGCADNQAVANHPCSVEHVLLYALVKYTIQLALQNTFSHTRYNLVVWALVGSEAQRLKMA